jgi:hypothetical protein
MARTAKQKASDKVRGAAARREGRKIGRSVDTRRVRSEAAATGRLAGQAKRAGANVSSRETDSRVRETDAAFRQTNKKDRKYTSSAFTALDTVDKRKARADRRTKAGQAVRKRVTGSPSSGSKSAKSRKIAKERAARSGNSSSSAAARVRRLMG